MGRAIAPQHQKTTAARGTDIRQRNASTRIARLASNKRTASFHDQSRSHLPDTFTCITNGMQIRMPLAVERHARRPRARIGDVQEDSGTQDPEPQRLSFFLNYQIYRLEPAEVEDFLTGERMHSFRDETRMPGPLEQTAGSSRMTSANAWSAVARAQRERANEPATPPAQQTTRA